MVVEIDEKSIKESVYRRIRKEMDYVKNHIQVDRWTPAGKPRSAPIYYVSVINTTLGKNRTIKEKSSVDLISKVKNQLETWAEQEIRSLTSNAIKDAKEAVQADTVESTLQAQKVQNDLKGILAGTLNVDDRIDWKALEDHRDFPPFKFSDPPKKPTDPPPPGMPKKPFFSFLIKSLGRKWEAQCEDINRQYQDSLSKLVKAFEASKEKWKADKASALDAYETEKKKFFAEQETRNRTVADYQKRFEQGDPDAIVEYINAVFERSNYPEDISLEYIVNLDPVAQTLVVNVSLPNQELVPDVLEYKYIAKSNEKKPVTMKKKDHDALYDDIVKQIVIRTIHEVFESVYTKHVMTVVVNGWVTYIDKASGNDQTSCIISVSADRETFERFNLARIDHTECIKSLKGLIAGPLSNVAPVKPILQLDTNDDRFIEARAVLAEMNASTNLAEIPWEDFEHLVRDLFGEMFSGEGVEVHVTQASRDQGVDAIVFDPDPIRGGKYVIQAKRYTRAVGVSAVRELYGTMINEGAVKGILVTTATYGRDSRQFVKDKPITLIDGSNLVYLLEQYGHKVRIDLEAARSVR